MWSRAPVDAEPGGWANIANISGLYWAEFLTVPGSDDMYLIGTSSDLRGVASVAVSRCYLATYSVYSAHCGQAIITQTPTTITPAPKGHILM